MTDKDKELYAAPAGIDRPYSKETHEQHFLRTLQELPHVEYWTHNPWQSPDSADAKATVIADKYLNRFTDSMMKKGYMPFFGVEVNALTHGVTANEIVAKLHAVIPAYYDAYTHRLPEVADAAQAFAHAPIAQHERPPAPPERETGYKARILRRFSELRHYAKPPVEPTPLAPEGEEALRNIRAAQEQLRTNGYMRSSEIGVLDTQLAILQRADTTGHFIHPQAMAKFRTYRHAFHKVRLNAYDPDIGIGHNLGDAANEEINGRIYQDFGGSSQELEIATRASSPLETAHSVNVIKQMIFECSYHYEDLYAKSSGLPEQLHAQLRDNAPRGELSGYLRNNIHTAFNIGFGTPQDNCGEHISISLQRRLDPRKNYDNARNFDSKDKHHDAMKGFGDNNLINSTQWREMLTDALKHYLPQDTLMGLGNLRLIDKAAMANRDESFHSFRGNGENVPTLRRVEIRSYHDASGNISLSLLAIMAVTQALITEINRDETIRNTFLDNPAAITEGMRAHVLDGLYKRYPSNPAVPRSMAEATERFQKASPTIAMMRQWANQHAHSSSERRSMHAEINQFEDLIIERARGMEKLPHPQQPSQQPGTQVATTGLEHEEVSLRSYLGYGGIDGLM